MLVGENFGEFSKLMANRQSFLPQIYRSYYVHICICRPIHQIFSPNNVSISEFANVFHHKVIYLIITDIYLCTVKPPLSGWKGTQGCP